MTKKQMEEELTEVFQKLLNDSPCLNIKHDHVELNFYKKNGEYHHYYDLEFNIADSGFDIYLDISDTGYYVVTSTEDDENKEIVENFLLESNGYSYYEGDSEYISDNDDVSCCGDAQNIADAIIGKFNELSNLISQAMDEI